MMEYLQRLFCYDDWANREVLSGLQTLEVAPPQPVKWLAHILSAERLWYERLQLQKATNPVWPDFSLERCKLEIEELPKLWAAYLQLLKEEGLTRLLSYKNTKGEAFSSPKQDILMHVILHSAYHRGQIAAAVRAAGFVPPYTDFIHAARQGFLEEEE
ncbi:MAG: DinB family protein [Terriglobales bacterium]